MTWVCPYVSYRLLPGNCWWRHQCGLKRVGNFTTICNYLMSKKRQMNSMKQSQTLHPWIWEFQLQILAPRYPVLWHSLWYFSVRTITASSIFFFCDFAKLRIKIVSFVMSVCLSIRPHGITQLLLDRFSWNLISEEFFENLSERIEVSLKSDQNNRYFTWRPDVFGGLVVSMLASGTQVCGFKPGRSRWIFTDVKILSMPSSGGEVKESVPCPSFAACKRT